MINCNQCNAACCRVLAVEIKKPKTKTDYEDILWHIFHKGVFVYIDENDDWMLQINTPCEKLDQKTNKCTIYDERPSLCRDYEVKDCFMNQREMKHIFMTEYDYKKYLKENVSFFKDIKLDKSLKILQS